MAIMNSLARGLGNGHGSTEAFESVRGRLSMEVLGTWPGVIDGIR